MTDDKLRARLIASARPLIPSEAARCNHRGPMGRRMSPCGRYSTCPDCGAEHIARKAAEGDPAMLELLALNNLDETEEC